MESNLLSSSNVDDSLKTKGNWSHTIASDTDVVNCIIICSSLRGSSNVSEFLYVLQEDPSHDFLLPPLEYEPNSFTLIETSTSLIFALHVPDSSWPSLMTKTTPMYRYGGFVHPSFYEMALKCNIHAMYDLALQKEKRLIICGHSLGGSVGHCCALELLYDSLPRALRDELSFQDAKHQTSWNKENQVGCRSSGKVKFPVVDIPNVVSIGFGSTFFASESIHELLSETHLDHCLLSIINDQDCIPGMINVSQAALLVSKSTERAYSISKTAASLGRFIPNLTSSSSSLSSSKFSVYSTLTWNVLQRICTFLKNEFLQGSNGYFPCGQFIQISTSTPPSSTSTPASTSTTASSSSTPPSSSSTPRMLNQEDALPRTFYLSNRKEIQELFNLQEETLTFNRILHHQVNAYEASICKQLDSYLIHGAMNYYERLNVSVHATNRDITVAYRTKAIKYHPDKCWNQPTEIKDQSERYFKLLAEAYEVLSDDELRRKYDEELKKNTFFVQEVFSSSNMQRMNLEEAIQMFSDVSDGMMEGFSAFSQRIRSSTAGVFTPARHVVSTPTPAGFTPGNHKNIFAQDKMRIVEPCSGGVDKIRYVDAEGYLISDATHSSIQPSTTKVASKGLSFKNAVGGAIMIGGSLAIAVAAWTHYSDATRRRKQAQVVRHMPPEFLKYLLVDSLAQKKQSNSFSNSFSNSSSNSQLNRINEYQEIDDIQHPKKPSPIPTKKDVITEYHQLQLDEEECLEKFYDCMEAIALAKAEHETEDLFFDCMQVENELLEILQVNKNDINNNYNNEEVNITSTTSSSKDRFQVGSFPVGVQVVTPLGHGRVLENFRIDDNDMSRVILDSGDQLQIQASSLDRGASLGLANAERALDQEKEIMVEKVLVAYHLTNQEIHSTSLWGVVHAGTDGVMDSGVKAAGGVALAKGMGGVSTAAPLALSAILVDIGREYLRYRNQRLLRDSNGMLTSMEEEIMMKDFRLSIGHHVVSGTAAAAGAGIGAYTTTAIAGSALVGPVGVVATTCAVVVGGILGYFAGSKLYSDSTNAYFTQIEKAKDEIQRLEIGARILFNEFDPERKGYISKSTCKQMILALQQRSGGSMISQQAIEKAMKFLQDDHHLVEDHDDYDDDEKKKKDTSKVSWLSFWHWVSVQALNKIKDNHPVQVSMNQLEEKDNVSCSESQVILDSSGNSWWNSHVVENTKNQEKEFTSSTSTSTSTTSCSVTTKRPTLIQIAQLESCHERGLITWEEMKRLLVHLGDQDETLSNAASKTLSDLLQSENLTEEVVITTQGGFDGTTNEQEEQEHLLESCSSSSSSSCSRKDQVDVLCSLLSHEGLTNLVKNQGLPSFGNAKREEIHYALLTFGETVGYEKIK